jgi:hypothetical protein
MKNKNYNKYLSIFCIVYIATIIMTMVKSNIFVYYVFFIIPFYIFSILFTLIVSYLKNYKIQNYLYLFVSLIYTYIIFCISVSFNSDIKIAFFICSLILSCTYLVYHIMERNDIIISYWGIYANTLMTTLGIYLMITPAL